MWSSRWLSVTFAGHSSLKWDELLANAIDTSEVHFSCIHFSVGLFLVCETPTSSMAAKTAKICSGCEYTTVVAQSDTLLDQSAECFLFLIPHYCDRLYHRDQINQSVFEACVAVWTFVSEDKLDTCFSTCSWLTCFLSCCGVHPPNQNHSNSYDSQYLQVFFILTKELGK